MLESRLEQLTEQVSILNLTLARLTALLDRSADRVEIAREALDAQTDAAPVAAATQEPAPERRPEPAARPVEPAGTAPSDGAGPAVPTAGHDQGPDSPEIVTWAEVKTLALEVFKKQGRETIDRITHGHGFKQFLELEAAPDKWAVFVNDCKEALA